VVPRGLAAVALALLLAGCSDSPGTPKVPDAPRAEAGRCAGIGYDEVRGAAPGNARAPLRDYPAAAGVCAAYWLSPVDDGFVPQSVEIDGTTAYVGGYGWVPERTERACQLARVDLRTGRTTAFVERIEAPVYGPEPTYCRHGGGLELTGDGLWVAEFERLWLLDPARIGHGDPVLRVWRIARPVLGSTMAIQGNRLGLALHRNGKSGRIWWFALDAVLAPGVTEVSGHLTTRRTPQRLQGMTATGRGTWFSSSTTHCAELRAPGRHVVSFVPGAEDVEVVGRDLWTVSEAGAEPYLDDHEQVVPQLLRLDRAEVLAAGEADCGWD
jgi:hypothetical protein